MKKQFSFFNLVVVLSLAMASGRESPVTITPSEPHPLSSRTIIVTRDDDRIRNGEPVFGTLRYALKNVQEHGKIIFDPNYFRPSTPRPIFIRDAPLEPIGKNYVTVEALGGGVILDGSRLGGNWQSGLAIHAASNVTIRGLQISKFSGPAIGIGGGAHGNLIEGNWLTRNQEGINISGLGTSNNTIQGNFIGVGRDGGPAGNTNRGITIYEGAHDNTIGPDNKIAYNGSPQSSIDYGLIGYDLYGPNDGCGIYIRNTEGTVDFLPGNPRIPTGFNIEVIEAQDSSGNKITENSIHDNKGNGICLVKEGTDYYAKGGANGDIETPYILSVDVETGFVGGFSCRGCTIEIFSSPNRGEGSRYEGTTIATGYGVFKFQKRDSSGQNVSFRYDNITVTATDGNSNTSEFSRPAGLFKAAGWLQEGNNNPAFLLLTKPSFLLPDNHISAWLDDYEKGYSDTDLVYRNGFKRIHIISLTGDGQDDWGTIINPRTLTGDVDHTITEYANRGVKIVLILAPGSGLPVNAHFEPGSGDFENHYSPYISFVTQHFKDRISYYEIWNEPENIAVEDYVTLVEQATSVIRAPNNHPDAKITIGAIGGYWENGYPEYNGFQRSRLELDYLNELLQSRVVNMVDGISFHPFFDNVPSDQYYQVYPQMVQGIKCLATDHDFTGEYFADDMMWSLVDEPDWNNGPPVSLAIAAKYYTRAIAENRGLGLNVTFNPSFQKPFLAPTANLMDKLVRHRTNSSIAVAF